LIGLFGLKEDREPNSTQNPFEGLINEKKVEALSLFII